MNKYYEIPKGKKTAIKKGDRFEKLTVCSDPYYIYPKNSEKHRRQHVDAKCECGKIREFINSGNLKRGGILGYCGYDCPIYKKDLPQTPPEHSKLCKLGEEYNYLTIIQEAFYDKPKGESNRYKCVKVKCVCGNERIYREDKVFAKKYKSCGCIWEKAGKVKSWKHLERTYGMTKSDYFKLLESQNNKCAICHSEDNKQTKSDFLYVDHCHKTKKVRGLLCNSCNTALGSFQDSKTILLNAIEYLNNNS